MAAWPHRSKPDAIRRVHVDAVRGLRPYHTRRLTGHLPPEAREGAARLLTQAWGVLVAFDATLVELNPFVLLTNGAVMALDAKVTIDDNALFRQPDVAALADSFPIDPVERRAKAAGLQYLKLHGEVGIIGNGAGLVMSTLDVVQRAGAGAANFLDVGGGATTEKVTAAFKILLSDKNVKAILVNIFGGIMKCDVVATGIVEAAREVGLSVPLVVRLEGTNVDLGKEILSKSGLDITPGENMADAAEKAVKAAGAVR